LHVTFVGVHFADWKNEKMITEFNNMIQSVDCFEAKTLKQEKLGEAEVVLIEKTKSVSELHNAILDFLDYHNAVYNNPEWNRQNYIPHSTIQKHARVSENANIVIDNLALVDMFPDGDGYMRKIIKVFKLKK
jgi:hypothetical protein